MLSAERTSKSWILVLFCVGSLTCTGLRSGWRGLSGEYERPHTVSMFDGEGSLKVPVKDELRLEQLQGGVRFWFLLVATNGHTCEMEGVAVQSHGHFEYRQELEEEYFGPEPCVLRIHPTAEEIVLEDVGHRCRAY